MRTYREYRNDAAKVATYEHRIRQGKDFAEKSASAIKRWWQRYDSEQLLGEQSSAKGHRVASPLGVSIIDSLFSSLTAADVDIIVEALGEGTRDQEYLASSALTKEWENCHVNDETAPAVKESLVGGLGWVKVAYEHYVQEQELPRADEDIASEIDAMFRQAETAGEHAPTLDDIMNFVPLTETKEEVLESRIVVDHVPWEDIIYDPTARRLQDVKWYAQKTLLPVEEVQQNPTFRAYCADRKTLKELDKLKADTHIDQSILGEGMKPNDEDKRITVWEIDSLETGTICWWAEGTKFLLNETVSPFALNDRPEDQTQFVPIVLRRSSQRVRGVSEMEVLESTLKEIDLYRSRMATYLERFTPKLLAEEGSITEPGKNALKSQDIGAVVEYKTGKAKPEPLQVPTIPSEVYAVPEKLSQLAFDATGASELTRGIFPDRKRTATETAEVVTASAARQSEKRLQLERFYTAVARRMLQLMQMFYTEERMVRYQDWGGPVEWSWEADDIVFESKLEIVLTPKEPRDRQALRDEALAMLNVFGPLAQTPDPATGAPLLDQRWLIRLVAEKMGFKRRDIALILKLPEEQQIEALQAQQQQAAMASAAQGVPRPDMTPGPLDEQTLAQAANAGTIPSEILLAAQGNTPVSPGAVEQLSESR